MKRTKIIAITFILILLCSLSFIACQSKTVITLNSNGGSGGTTQVYPVYGELMPSAEAPSRNGYKFEGYFDAKVGGTWYYDGKMNPMRTWRGDGDLTLYAQWTPLKYGITLDMRGGKDGIATVVATMGQPLVYVKGPTRSGYKFVGYFDAPEGGEMYYDELMQGVKAWDKHEVSKLYAQWDILPYSVTLDAGAGSGGTAEIEVKIDNNMPSANAPSREGHTFIGYYAEPNGKGVKYYNTNMQSVSPWTKAEDATIYAYYAPFVNGLGTAEEPFIISSRADFDKMRGHTGDFKGLYFKLGSDINYQNENWIPIGARVQDAFRGNFDGDGKTISNFTISQIPDNYAGIFGYVEGNISNLNISSFTINASATRKSTGIVDTYYAGGIVGNIFGTISNCSAVDGIMDMDGGVGMNYFGMIAGVIGSRDNTNNSEQECGIYNTFAESSQSGNHMTFTRFDDPSDSPNTGTAIYAGGLVGRISYATVSGCYAKINIYATNKSGGERDSTYIGFIGAFISYANESDIRTSYAAGDVYAVSNESLLVSGFLANTNNSTFKDKVIENCYSTGNVGFDTVSDGMKSVKAAGLVTYAFEGVIRNCYTTANINVQSLGLSTIMSAPLVADIYRVTFFNCFVAGNIELIHAGSTYHGRAVANNDKDGLNLHKIYYYENQIFNAQQSGTASIGISVNEQGEAVSEQTLSNAAFYTDTLEWSADIWDFSNLSVSNNRFPTFKQA